MIHAQKGTPFMHALCTYHVYTVKYNIPLSLDSHIAMPMLCGDITIYSKTFEGKSFRGFLLNCKYYTPLHYYCAFYHLTSYTIEQQKINTILFFYVHYKTDKR